MKAAHFRSVLHQIILSICLAICVATLGQAGSSAEQGNASQSTNTEAPGKIIGHVYRADNGQPIASVEVRLDPVASGRRVEDVRKAIESRRSALTNSEGEYTFAEVVPGNYDLRAEHVGFVARFFNSVNVSGDEPDFEHSMELITVNAGQTLSKIDFRLSASGMISGKISNEDKQPLPVIQVIAVRYRYVRGGQQEMEDKYFGVTDKLGNYTLPDLLPGTYFVRADKVNGNVRSGGRGFSHLYYPGSGTLDGALRLHLLPGSQLTGTNFIAVTQKAHTISGNIIDQVGADRSQSYWIKTTRLGTISDESAGTEAQSTPGVETPFEIRGLPPGDYILTAERNHPFAGPAGPRGSGVATVHLGDSDSRVDIQISPPGEVGGKFFLDRSPNRFIAGVKIHLQPRAPFYGFDFEAAAVTGQDGGFRIRNVLVGEYFFSLEEEDNSDAYIKHVACDGNDNTIQPLKIQPGGVIKNCLVSVAGDFGAVKGVVLSGDKPAANLLVIAIPQLRLLREQARYTVTANTNQNGEYQLLAVAPGDYFVFAITPDVEQPYFAIDYADGHQQDAVPVSVKPGETKVLDLKPLRAK